MELSSAEDRLRAHSGMVTHEDEKLMSLIAWLNNSSKNLTFDNRLPLSGCSGHTVLLTRTAEEDRREVFKQFFDTLPMLPSRLYAARMQVIKAKIQIRKHALIAPEVVCDVAVTQSSKGPSRSLRSGLSCKDDNDKDTTSAPTQQPIMMTEDGDKQCVRELRNFLRATLGELHKEKKCLVFWRPVDPESVPDYYDVISCPMDLETMRMKVKSTYFYFLSMSQCVSKIAHPLSV
jgi:Bromodomain